MKRVLVICLSVCFASFSDQKSTPQDDTYVAAVLEYQFTRNTSQNLRTYLDYIRQAAEQDVDILVFPEMTLTRGDQVKVPIHSLLKEHPVPALRPDLYDEILVALSAATRQHQIYAVVNLQEEMDCANAPGEYCPDAKAYLFNTNVVFDRNGAVIDRYRKINLFGEYTRHPALRPDLGLFTTDFGVTFGHFICFDIMFQVPATQIVQKHKLTDVIFSTMWFSELPFLTGVQTQEEYAYTMNVNLLGANANNLKLGTAGSGIFSGNAGALISTMSGTAGTRLLVSRLPKKPGHVTYKYPGPMYDDPTKADNLVINKDLSLPRSVSRALVTGFQEFTLAQGDVSCRFRVKTKVEHPPEGVSKIPKFRAFVKDGTNTYAKRKIGVAFCAVVACKDDTAISCPYRFEQDETFTEIEELEIEMTTYSYQHNGTLDCDNVVYYPSTFLNNKYPLHPQNFTFIKSSQNAENSLNTNIDNKMSRERSDKERVTLKLVQSQKELVTFSLWGRLSLRDVNTSVEVDEEDVNNYIEIENLIYNHGDKQESD